MSTVATIKALVDTGMTFAEAVKTQGVDAGDVFWLVFKLWVNDYIRVRNPSAYGLMSLFGLILEDEDTLNQLDLLWRTCSPVRWTGRRPSRPARLRRRHHPGRPWTPQSRRSVGSSMRVRLGPLPGGLAGRGSRGRPRAVGQVQHPRRRRGVTGPDGDPDRGPGPRRPRSVISVGGQLDVEVP